MVGEGRQWHFEGCFEVDVSSPSSDPRGLVLVNNCGMHQRELLQQ